MNTKEIIPIISHKDKRRNKYQYGDKFFDSKEEIYVYWYLEEMRNEGIIYDIVEQPKSFKLFVSNNKNNKEKLRNHIYTADFRFLWNEDYKEYNSIMVNSLFDYQAQYIPEYDDILITSYLEVKPKFDRNNMTRIFRVNQKWVASSYNVVVNLTIPEKLFKKSFYPSRYLYTDTGNKKRVIKDNNIVLFDYYLKQLKDMAVVMNKEKQATDKPTIEVNDIEFSKPTDKRWRNHEFTKSPPKTIGFSSLPDDWHEKIFGKKK